MPMPTFLIDLWLDGYDNEKSMKEACAEFIYDQLNVTASSVTIIEVDKTLINGKVVYVSTEENSV
jgi:hypothetical protein